MLKARGPKKELRATLPKLPAAGRLHGPRVQPLVFSSAVAVAVARQPLPLVPGVAVANQACAPGFEMLALPTRFARQGPVSSSLPQSRYDGVNGMPDCHSQTPESCQPPRRASTGRDAFLRKWRLRPNGSS